MSPDQELQSRSDLRNGSESQDRFVAIRTQQKNRFDPMAIAAEKAKDRMELNGSDIIRNGSLANRLAEKRTRTDSSLL